MRIDTRAGSKELIAPLMKLGVPVEPGILAAGDVEILGNGPGGFPTLIGIEHKTIEDAVACMRNGRFAEQARGMRSYFEVSWLLVEGRVRVGKRVLEVRKGEKWMPLHAGVTYQELAAWLISMAQAQGILLYRTESKAESVLWLRALNNWWTAKDWEEHRAHLEWYTPPSVGNPFLREPPLVERAAALLPHIGVVKAGRVAKEFRSLKKMTCVSQEEWVTIPGVGKKMAAAIVKAIEEEA